MKFKKITATLLAAAMLSSVPAAGCGSKVNANATAATLDGKEISMGVANFMAQYQAAQMDSYFLSYYGEDMWTSDSGDGTTMTDSVKKSVMENIREYYLLDAHTSDYNVELTEEEKTAITQAASQFLDENSAEALDKMGATQETVEEMLRLYKIQSKMHAAIIEEIDTKVTDGECAQKTFSYVRFDKESDTDTTADDEDTVNDTDAAADGEDTAGDADTAADGAEDATKDNKQTAGEFLKSAGDDLEAAAQAGEYTVLKCSYGAGDLEEDGNTTSMDVAVLEAADKLKDGQMASSVIETDNNYYVIRMDSTDDKDAAKTKKESILTQRRNDKYAETVENYKDASEWKINESEWKKVNFDELYTMKAEETDTSTEDGTDTEGGIQAGGTETDTEGGTQAGGTETDTEGGTQAGGTETDTEGGTQASGTQTDTEGGTQAEGTETGADGVADETGTDAE